MKVIDLLNKIANGEELPNEIKHEGIIYERYEYNNKYYEKGAKSKERDILSIHLANESFYNSELEIIEEDKEIEKMGILYTGLNGDIYENFAMKINEVIDVVNKLNKKN